ncbi:oxygen-independent coproporphyrinogen III oxidase-like protein [Bordetella parapertussis]|uniref:Heme chaperone HemW n=5 Tax=Bordetella TaxID=517 RepID=A0A0H3LNK5_BORBR|nr:MULTISPECIES: radical SAM family heme chaperone HemW [Bordetella]KAK61436.1 putative coproporphyrinogen dehydrogenase [Bordetella bronchiseptica 980-2]SHR68037.1 Probable oxygen-independent coproporphyrinogen III oxidase HemN [Mycobacteroides abscessus subsp. abscessus]AMG89137.1 oxygen-independent coproporphyrinogen III oxidase-like protein [Bordetella bronchiseptica]AOB39998.1 YggW family oxidoreductase [Bordetella parapertussis]AUL44007.1 YggW family oxidoreductase [Bordetella parapertus
MAITIPIRNLGGPAAGARVLAPAGATLTSLPPLSVYVHVPWCVRKCPYCDFNSHAAPGEIPERAYLDALRADLEQAVPEVWGRQVISVFIGGGTPSLLSAAGLDELLAMLRACLNLLPDAEITMEANPGTAEAGRFRDYAASGVTRLSLGIQSFDDAQLSRLGRIHDAAQARAAIAMAQQAVERVNLDLMFALPGQELEQCRADLRQALAFGTEHLSLYHLTLEPNTVFAKYPPELPDDDASAAMQDMVEETLAQAGLARYEVSAYARRGARCRHNLNYWEFGDYLGLGPGAHGKLSFHDRIERQARLRNPDSWMQRAMARDGSHVAESRVVGAGELPFEFMLNALRLKEGVAASSFGERTGLSLAAIAHQLEAATRRGLLDADPTRLRATALGWRFLNDLQEMFL